MTSTELRDAERIVAGWRSGHPVELDSPAGPLYAAGEYAEADLIMSELARTLRCGTDCTNTGFCC